MSGVNKMEAPDIYVTSVEFYGKNDNRCKGTGTLMHQGFRTDELVSFNMKFPEDGPKPAVGKVLKVGERVYWASTVIKNDNRTSSGQ